MADLLRCPVDPLPPILCSPPPPPTSLALRRVLGGSRDTATRLSAKPDRPCDHKLPGSIALSSPSVHIAPNHLVPVEARLGPLG